MSALLFTVVIAVGIAFLLMVMYNKLVRMRNSVDESWSSVGVQLKRRYDLIPNLVATAKGIAKHEEDTFTKVVEARAKAMNANTNDVNAQGAAENLLSSALGRVFAVAEAYPELKSNQNFLNLQNSLSEVEDQIQLARRYYNATVRDYNTYCQTFPSMIPANMFNFKPAYYFEVEEAAKENVKVQF